MKELEQFTKVVSVSEWNKLNRIEKQLLIDYLQDNIYDSLESWLDTEFSDWQLKDITDTSINIPILEAIDSILSKDLIDSDGLGNWHFIQKSTGRHFRGTQSFSCSSTIEKSLNNLYGSLFGDFSDYNSFSKKEQKQICNMALVSLKEDLERFDFELVGIMWYNQ